MGMSKSLVVIALAASDSGQTLPLLKYNLNLTELKARTQLKATLVVTSVSLMDQWEDEVKKHSNLKCYRFHASKSKYGNNLKPKCASMMKDADIIVTTGTHNVSEKLGHQYMFNRVCVDEAHLLGYSSSMSRLSSVGDLCSQRRWCVTATPRVSSIQELDRQGEFLGHCSMDSIYRTAEGLPDIKLFLSVLVDLLSKRMTRFARAQRINGSKALALPKSTTHSVTVHMDHHDTNLYSARKLNIDLNSLRHMRGRMEPNLPNSSFVLPTNCSISALLARSTLFWVNCKA